MKTQNLIGSSKNSPFFMPEPNGIDTDKLDCIIATVSIFMMADDSLVNKALLSFANVPDSWKVFNEDMGEWNRLSDIEKMERTINFVIAIKDYERQRVL